MVSVWDLKYIYRTCYKKVKNKGLILDNVNLKINAGTFNASIGPD
jgi:Fe-S cluster assembly ATPase SufC